VFAARLEVVGKPRPGYAESEVDRAMSVGSPISLFARAQSAGPFCDSTLDRGGIVPGQSEADRDLCVQTRPIGLDSGGLARQVGDMRAVRVSQRSTHWVPNWQTLAFYMKPISRSCNLPLQLRVRNLKPVHQGQLDADPTELLVAVHGERAPLLRAELERRKDGLSALAIADVDHLAPVGEGGRAALAHQTVVDYPSVDHRLERSDVVRHRPLELRSLKTWGLTLPIAPFLCEVGTPIGEPLLEVRESFSR
jgi:hypothetical protein